jgi:predicted outer membrane lipoprotein
MKIYFQFVVYMLIAVIAIVLGVIIGDYGSWYFSWLVGTGMMVLVSAAGGAFMDMQLQQQEDEAKHNNAP